MIMKLGHLVENNNEILLLTKDSKEFDVIKSEQVAIDLLFKCSIVLQ